MDIKPKIIRFAGSSQDDIRNFGKEASIDIGAQLMAVQVTNE